MSLFLGNARIAPTQVIGEILDEGDEVLKAVDRSALNTAINYRIGKADPRSINKMITDLNQQYLINIKLNMDILQRSYSNWVRPNNWPDLDSLNLQMSGDDYIYMTYDATSEFSGVALHIEKTRNGADINCTLGHITNGEYIIDEVITGVDNNYVYWFNNYQYDYPVVRITGDIKYCYCYSVVNENDQTLFHRKQLILERIAYVPHLVKFCTSYSANAWTTYSLEREKIGNGDGNDLVSLYYAWGYGRNLRSLDISNLSTPNVTDMQYCFSFCGRLTGTLDLRNFSVPKIVNLAYAFSNCTAIEYIDIRGWELPILSYINGCFNGCNALKEIKGIDNIYIDNCTTLSSTFADCYSLKELDLSHWNTANVTSFSSLFNNCNSLTSLNIANWNTSKVTTFANTFANCMSLEYIDVKNWDTSKSTSFAGTFSGCRSVKILDLSNWTNATLTTVGTMFQFCHSLQYLNILNITITSSCTNVYAMFNGCWCLKEINLNSNWDMSGLSNSSSATASMFSNCYSVEKITGIKNWQFYCTNSLASEFSNCYNLKVLDVSGWRVNTITSFANMFSNCYSLENLDISQWNVQSATSLASMFQNNYHLKELNLANWNTENCTTFASMFSGCRSLTTIGNLSNWNTAKVTTIADMFMDCRSLKEINGLSNWDVRKITTAAELFYNTRSLTELTIENWNLAACTSLTGFCRGAWGLKTLSLKNWSIPKIASTQSYFCVDCISLQNILYTVPIPYNHTYNGDDSLTHESLMVIINNLPTVTTTRTLNLTTANLNTLTAAEKAIATNKGWTLAN